LADMLAARPHKIGALLKLKRLVAGA